jgi:hypothetical protein
MHDLRRNREATEKTVANLQSAVDCASHDGHNLPDMQWQETDAVALQSDVKASSEGESLVDASHRMFNGEKVIHREA